MKIIKPHFEWVSDKAPDGVAIIARIAEMGRVAYQTEPGNRSDADFVRHLIARGHESVLEHAIVSVKIVCDRGVTHEEVRHRVASYTQESTRYCNYSKDKFGKSITYIDLEGGIKLCPVTSKLPPETIRAIWAEWWDACRDAEKHYMRMLELGASPQIARSVLNNSTKTQIATTMNIREWRHFFRLRTAPDAHPQMREMSNMLLGWFKTYIPVVFDDIEVSA